MTKTYVAGSNYKRAKARRDVSAKFQALCWLSLAEQARVTKLAKVKKLQRLEQEFRHASDAFDAARRELRAA